MSSVTPFAIQPVLLSTLGHCLLQGIIFCQMVSFHQQQARDSVRLKAFIYTLFVLCLVQTAHESYKIWTVTVDEREWNNNPSRYLEFPLNSLICALVQGFLIRRVWKVTGRRWMVLLPLGFLLFISLFGSLATSVTIGKIIDAPFVNVTNCHGLRCIPEFSAWLWGSAILDATITVTLSVYLIRSKSGFHHLDAVVTKIWNLTLITAAFPMISMLAAVSLFYTTGGVHYRTVIALTIISSKLYFNGLLRQLNVRDKLRATLRANSMGRHSIVTIGSPTPRKAVAHQVSDGTDIVEEFSTLNDIEKTADHDPDGYVDHSNVPEEPPVARLRPGNIEFDLERGNSVLDLSTKSTSDGHEHLLAYKMPASWEQVRSTA